MAQFTSTGSFFVKDKSGNYYSATFLANSNGNPIVDPVVVGTPSLSPHTPQQLALYSDQAGTVMSNPGNYLVVPSADFMNSMYVRGQAYGTLLNSDPDGASAFLSATFVPKFGVGDAQYQSQRFAATDTILRSGDHLIPAFTDAGNFGVGVFGQGAYAATNGTFSSTDLLQIFGSANKSFGGNNTSAPFGNSPWGYESISEGFNFTTVKPSSTSSDPNDLTPAFHHCFVRGTPVLLADGQRKPIEQIKVGDIVFAFDGRGKLQPRRVLGLFENTTTELIELSPAPDHRREAEAVGFTTLTVTPAHAFLTADGQFREIGKTIKQSNLQGAPAQIVLSSGTVIGVQAKHIAWSLETADRYERSEVLSYASAGNRALAPRIEQGWKTYNFEVEDLHTYVAGGVRVHNDSDPAFAIDANAFQQVFGHSFTGSPGDMGLLGGAIATGQLQPTFGNVDTTGTDRFTGPFFTGSGDKIVVAADSTTWFASMVRNGEVGRIIQNNNDGSRIDSQFDWQGVLQTVDQVLPRVTQSSNISTLRTSIPTTNSSLHKAPTARSTLPKSRSTRTSLPPAAPSARSSVRRSAARWRPIIRSRSSRWGRSAA
jgi:Hom_end-associated Hint